MNASERSRDPRVSPPLGGLAGTVAEHEREAADDPEDDEVGSVVLEVRVELPAKQQRGKPDQRERCGEKPND